MMVLMEAAAKTSEFPLAFTLVYAVGFVAAVVIGSIAWYNSKRPPGWEDKSRPDIVPEVDNKEE
ncbi:photosystem II assembly protein Psb35 [Egbenema bharatensis]|uniref:photosystem II assembly protein Psb35 n=1 Tax=Egbenema bharatensis TaxID=3463334 RepID=UPI003A859926